MIKAGALGYLQQYREALACFEEAERLGDVQAGHLAARLRQSLGLA
jgi:hypothetical protein